MGSKTSKSENGQPDNPKKSEEDKSPDVKSTDKPLQSPPDISDDSGCFDAEQTFDDSSSEATFASCDDDNVPLSDPPTPDDIPDDGPRPIQVVKADSENHSFALDEEALKSILMRPDVVNRKVAVISVAGAFRQGKSFMLNFFLRYLKHSNSEDEGAEDWLGDASAELSGFKWCGGSERQTAGILIWSEPFFMKMPSGEEVVVLLMDTQGSFDSESTVKDCATIFALSTMISSHQIYNLSQHIQEDYLQHLQLFTDYGRLALESSLATPFQALTFLVRDWRFPSDNEYGAVGGSKLLERRLTINEKQHEELRQLREHIKTVFKSINCYLMPHPGKTVATSPDFKGRLQDIDTDFTDQLRDFVPRLLSANTLVLKEVNGQQVTCGELMGYFRAYIEVFRGDELPEPKSVFLATAEVNNLVALDNSKLNYMENMTKVCGGGKPYMSPEKLREFNEKFRDEAIKTFESAPKMGGDEYSRPFLQRLIEELEEAFQRFTNINCGKRFHFKFGWLSFTIGTGTLAAIGVVLLIIFCCL